MTKTMKVELRPFRTKTLVFCLGLASALLMTTVSDRLRSAPARDRERRVALSGAVMPGTRAPRP